VGNDLGVTGSGLAIIDGLGSDSDITGLTNILTDSHSHDGHAAYDDGSATFWKGLNDPQIFGSDPIVTEHPGQATSSGQLLGIDGTSSSRSA